MTAERPNEAAASNSFEFDALREAVRYRTALVKEFTPFLNGRVIEIGAGIGQITEHLMQLPAIQTLVSIEPDSAFCQAFRSTYPRQTLFEGTIDRLPSGSDAQAILSINVLEHIRDDAQEIISYQKLLRQERGYLCLFVPARPEIYAPIDKDFGHHRRYTLPELSGKLQRAAG